MDDETSKPPSANLTAVTAVPQPSKTLRVKLATSLRLQAEWVARNQGVSVGYLVTKAIEEKILRIQQRSSGGAPGDNGVHLVTRKLPS